MGSSSGSNASVWTLIGEFPSRTVVRYCTASSAKPAWPITLEAAATVCSPDNASAPGCLNATALEALRAASETRPSPA